MAKYIDKKELLKAVKKNPYNLMDASAELQNDKNIVIEAIKQNGMAIDFASNDLKNDGEANGSVSD